MNKVLRLMVVAVALVAFGFSTVAVAAEFYVVKAGAKLSVTDKKPADAKTIVKGPFKTKKEADDAMKQGAAGSATKAKTKPVQPPDEGC
jgi:ActR/RegA family two-component response regulator